MRLPDVLECMDLSSLILIGCHEIFMCKWPESPLSLNMCNTCHWSFPTDLHIPNISLIHFKLNLQENITRMNLHKIKKKCQRRNYPRLQHNRSSLIWREKTLYEREFWKSRWHSCLYHKVQTKPTYNSFNKRRDDFSSLLEYNDYLEEVEDISKCSDLVI